MIKWVWFAGAACLMGSAACGLVQVKTGEEARKEIEARKQAEAEAAKAKEPPPQNEAEAQPGAGSSSQKRSSKAADEELCNDEMRGCNDSCRDVDGCTHCGIVETCKGRGSNPDACYICWQKCKSKQDSCFKHYGIER